MELDFEPDSKLTIPKDFFTIDSIEKKLLTIVTRLYHSVQEETIQIESPRQQKSPNKKSEPQKSKSDEKIQIPKKQSIWNELKHQFEIPDEASINMLYTNEDLILQLLKIIGELPFADKSKEIITDLVKKIDPSFRFLKVLISPLIQVLQNSGHQLNRLSTILFTLKVLFQQQTPINDEIDSYIELYGGEGIKCDQTTRWPFEKSGTITLWYHMYKSTQECKLFEIKNSEGTGFEIILKNGKLYFQKTVQEKKFRLMKNNIAYLCDCEWQKSVKLCVYFEIKKKFFQPIFQINVIMNNFVMTNIEVDMISFSANDFQISLFKNYFGKVFSALVLKSNLPGTVEELNGNKGLIYQNDIKNFGYIFENEIKNVHCLYSAIRSIAVYDFDHQFSAQSALDLSEKSLKNIQTSQDGTKLEFIQDSQRSSNQGSPSKNNNKFDTDNISFNFIYPIRKPQYLLLFDSVNRNNAKIIEQGNLYRNISITRELINYGGLKSFLPFLQLLKPCASSSPQFKNALNEYLLLIKSIFLNKAQGFQEAYKIHFFKMLATFLDDIKLQGFDIEIICSLKEVYVTLNTRMMRQSFVKQLVWGLKTAVYLQESKFEAFIKFIKTFYNEDIQSMLASFGIQDIINFILDNYDQPNCCFEHTRASIDGREGSKISNYFKVVKEYLSLIENILMIKRNQTQELQVLIKDVLKIFTLNSSACFIEAFVLFLSELFSKDPYFEKIFLQLMNSQNYKLSVYMCLAYSYSWKTKTKLIELVLHVFGPTILKQFSDEDKDEKHFISLCIKFPVIMSLPMRPTSSIKSQDRQYSIDQSEDKLSMNSTNLKRYTVMKTIDQEDASALLNEQDIARVILQWSFSQEVVQKTQENENIGISILMQIYKGSTYKIRKYITNLLIINQKLLSLGSAIMPSFIECLFVCQYDSEYFCNKDQIIYAQICQTKKNLFQLICSYKTDFQSSELPQLVILKLIIASVKAKFSVQVSRLSNRIYLLISDSMFKRYLEDLKRQEWKDEEKFNIECEKVIYNAYNTLVEYFCQRGQQNQLQFEEDTIQMAEKQYHIMISVMQKILELLLYITAPNTNSTVMSDNNSKRNKFIASILFPQKKQGHVSFFSFIFVILQTIFQNFEDLNITQRKTVLTLLKKYIIYMVQLTQNSSDFQIQLIQQQLRNNFLIPLAFLENKFYQYFYYGFQKHKNLDFTIENRIRKNVQDIKSMICNTFLDLIDMVKQIDQIGSMEHKSFYELMKPKRKATNKPSIKNFYPTLWKKSDDKIIEFMCLPSKVLKQQAKEKLQTHLIQKRLSLICSSIEKVLTKKIQTFINFEKKKKAAIQQKSVYSYISKESVKCKKLCDTEQQITVLKIQYGQKQKTQQLKRKQKCQKCKRQMNNIKRKIWNSNRCFGGLWSNQKLFDFSQNNVSIFNQPNKQLQIDNSLRHLYKRVRSKKQSKFSLTPFIKIVALPIDSDNEKSFEEIYLSDLTNSHRQHSQVREQLKSQKYLKIGLAFIKKKFIQKIMKKGIGLGMGKQSETIEQPVSKNEKFYTKGAIWIKPMLVCQVNVELNQKSLIIYHQSSHSYQHLSLLKNQQTQHDLLMKQWKIEQIQSFQIRTFMLRPTAIQIFFSTRKSLFLSFYGKSQVVFNKFMEFLNKFSKIQVTQKIPPPLTIAQPSKQQDRFLLTQKWVNRQISNFQYLLSLNILGGRSNCDLNQYFVFPWILKAYEKSKEQYRDLSLNMGSLGSKERLEKFKDVKNNLQASHRDEFPQSHNFGFHYSNIAIVLQYLIRINPYAQGARHLQGGKFDIPDRLFCSISESYNNSTNEMSDIRELIPQFFYFPEFLINAQRFDFGVQQNSKKVNSVQVPRGFSNAYDFIERHRELLQSEAVSLNLHSWIDLIFGYKQTGKEADNANNKFHYLAYEQNYSYVAALEDGNQTKEAMESHMAYFGKIPTQLFLKPHPKRSQIEKSLNPELPKIKTAEPFKTFSPVQNYESQLIKHLNGYFSVSGQTPVFFHYSPTTKKYLILKRNGQGIIFSIENSAKHPKQVTVNKPNTAMNIERTFELFVDKFENLYTFDESIYFDTLPIVCLAGQYLFFGGVWGGKIIRYDIKCDKLHVYGKHSATVTSMCLSEELNVLVSGSFNGQVVVWSIDYKNLPNQLPQFRLMFKEKLVIHYDQIKNITVNTDLRVAFVSSRDGHVSIVDLTKCEAIRMIQVHSPVLNCLLISYPYYLLWIECEGNRQYCYSLNGQLLNEYSFESLEKHTKSLRVHFKELIVLKEKRQNYFMLVQLPSMGLKEKIMINEEDNNVCNFVPTFYNNKVEVMFNTQKQMVRCTYPIDSLVLK